jgi:hypothetical protein
MRWLREYCHSSHRSQPCSASRPRRSLTGRSTGAPTAGHQARAAGTRYIVCGPGLASSRCRPVNSALGCTLNRVGGSSSCSLHLPRALLVCAWPYARYRAGARRAPQGRVGPLAQPFSALETAAQSSSQPAPAFSVVGGSPFSRHHGQHRAWPPTQVQPNRSFNRTANGRSPWPHGAYGSSCTARPRRPPAGGRLTLR